MAILLVALAQCDFYTGVSSPAEAEEHVGTNGTLKQLTA
jgi:hypothetical protein